MVVVVPPPKLCRRIRLLPLSLGFRGIETRVSVQRGLCKENSLADANCPSLTLKELHAGL